MKSRLCTYCFLIILLRVSVLAVPVFQHNDMVCLVGDSITHSAPYHSYVFLYYATRSPQERLEPFPVKQ
jgi:hypothetical protein